MSIRLSNLTYIATFSRRLSIPALIALVIGFLLSCKSNTSQILEDNKSSKPLVLTTFTVLADISRNIAGDRLLVRSVTKQGVEIHGYKPTPSDLVKASKADLIVENGLGLELWAKDFIAAAGDVPKVVLTDGMKPIPISGDLYNGRPNPHAWMSPKRAQHYVDKLVQAFTLIDPNGKEMFILNAEKYKSELQKLDNELIASLGSIPPEKRLLVSCEGAFSYLAEDYGMEEAYLWPVNAESQVTPKRMLNLVRKIKEKKIPTIFCESTVSDKAQREVARISGTTFGGTFYVDSLSPANGPASTFLDLQRHNVQLIRQGLAQN
ncbi:metal ABC transporter substrate-binding protein [Prochlorococcus marinus]|uniref:ABC transporter, substrate binding protein, possibly Mn n=1 Tax=Prochlorococcus marinus (strain MIT 9211) TaxID=93059 RepID=A9BAW8_PROM4|nr:metal ABC transporter substrate-binding protein [Prochlorococcus marinus]ABX08980.1 ABC transporter, substrate binding protein, possibly Mn [Prochlorococcus marinus str. MIT 9211]